MMKLNTVNKEKPDSVSDTFYKDVLSKLPDLIFQLSLTEEGNLSFTFFNKAVIRYFELSKEEIRFFNLTDVFRKKIYQDDFDELFQSIKNIKEDQTVWHHEFRANLPSKGVRWFSCSASVTRRENEALLLSGRMTDVTDKKIEEIELNISKQRFQFAMNASKKGVWDYNLVTEKVFYSSQSMKMLGFEEQDIISTASKWDDRIHPHDVINYYQSIQDHIEGKTPFYENAKRMLTKNGEYKWILSRGKVIEKDHLGNPIRLIGTHTDISKQKEYETKIEHNLQLINEKNSRLLNFAHIVSHNLSSHTWNFQMLLDLINEETNENCKNEMLTHLRTSSDALNQTIEHLKELVDINTTSEHKKENLNLNSYLNKVLDVLSEEIKYNNVKITSHIPENCNVAFNSSYLESILLNFTTNAIKYSHPERNPEICYKIQSNNGDLMLQIEDNGLGIDLKKHGNRLFGMYKTFHKNANSRGIGLFITKNQIESMGGKIEVESKINEGTIFKIFFSNES